MNYRFVLEISNKIICLCITLFFKINKNVKDEVVKPITRKKLIDLVKYLITKRTQCI